MSKNVYFTEKIINADDNILKPTSSYHVVLQHDKTFVPSTLCPDTLTSKTVDTDSFRVVECDDKVLFGCVGTHSGFLEMRAYDLETGLCNYVLMEDGIIKKVLVYMDEYVALGWKDYSQPNSFVIKKENRNNYVVDAIKHMNFVADVPKFMMPEDEILGIYKEFVLFFDHVKNKMVAIHLESKDNVQYWDVDFKGVGAIGTWISFCCYQSDAFAVCHFTIEGFKICSVGIDVAGKKVTVTPLTTDLPAPHDEQWVPIVKNVGSTLFVQLCEKYVYKLRPHPFTMLSPSSSTSFRDITIVQ